MDSIFYLPNCGTCQKVLAQTAPNDRFVLQNIKENPISAGQLDALASTVGSYGALFNKQSRKYREFGLADQQLSETDYRNWILEDYTFLKRPIYWVDGNVFICRSAPVVHQLKQFLGLL
jgi:arsenate reductase (glutaredoxin)